MHDIVPVIAIVAVFGSFASIFIIPAWLRSKERMRMQDTVREAIQHGQGVPTDVIEAITRSAKPVASRMRDIRRGVILLALTGVVVTWGVLDQMHDGWVSPSGWFGFAALPGFLGLTFLVFGLLNHKRD